YYGSVCAHSPRRAPRSSPTRRSSDLAERYRCLTDEPELAEQLGDMGILLQINAGSITGDGGRRIRKFIRYLMDEDLVFCVGTDADRKSTRLNSVTFRSRMPSSA